jgi:hypothetical protein
VTNLGTPIPPDVLGKIFEPFRRGPTHEPGGRRGLGLGLYIVRQIVLSHGGSVTAKSGADDGTVFTVRLPRHGIETGPVGLTPKDAGSPKFESGGPAPVSHSRSRLRPPTPTVEASLSSKKVS